MDVTEFMPSRHDEFKHLLRDIELFDFQEEGVTWMADKYTHHTSGILGDVMGLGKTIQTIAFLEFLSSVREITEPALIIVPLSTLSSWTSHIKNHMTVCHSLIFLV